MCVGGKDCQLSVTLSPIVFTSESILNKVLLSCAGCSLSSIVYAGTYNATCGGQVHQLCIVWMETGGKSLFPPLPRTLPIITNVGRPTWIQGYYIHVHICSCFSLIGHRQCSVAP